MIDASPFTGPTNIHDYVPEDDVSIIMNSEELFEEHDEIMDMAVDCNVIIFSPIEKALQYWRQPSTNPRQDLKSVCTEPTMDTNDSPLDCTNDVEVILSLFPELLKFVSDLESELEASMYKVFRLNSDYCSLVATAPTIPMPSLLDTKSQSNMTIPSKYHLTWYDTVDCIVEPLPLLDLPIIGQSDKQAKASNDAW
jgi:hypothetical protein